MFSFLKIAGKMGFYPRKTIREVVDTNPMFGFYILASLSVIQSYLLFSRSLFINFSFNFFISLGFVLLLSPFLGALFFSIQAYFLRYVGNKWLAGNATMPQIKACVAWSTLPSALNLLYTIFLLVIFPGYFFDSPFPTVFTNIQSLLTNGIMIWNIVLLIVTVSEVQQFTIGKTIGNFLLYLLLLFVIIFMFVLVLSTILGFFK
jgi:hypothetical protein